MSTCLKSQRVGHVGSVVRYHLGQLTLITIGGKHYVPHVINISRSGWGEGRKQAVVFGKHTLEIVI